MTIKPGETAKVVHLVRAAVTMQTYVEEALASLGRPYPVQWDVPQGWDVLPAKATLTVQTANALLREEFSRAEIDSFSADSAGKTAQRLQALAQAAAK